MIVTLPCGHTVDDLHYDTVCWGERFGHWPLGTSPRSYCKRCDLYHPECRRNEMLQLMVEKGKREGLTELESAQAKGLATALMVDAGGGPVSK
jgi:hypothetical protein